METYKFETKISENRIITLPHAPKLFNREVEIIILPKPKKKHATEKKVFTAMDFVKKWSGVVKGKENISDEMLDNMVLVTKYR